MANNDELLNAITAGLPASTSWSIKAATASYTQISSGAGILHAVYVGSRSCPSMSFYDNASGISGTNVISLDANLNIDYYVYDFKFSNGLALWSTVGNAANIKISYK